MNPAANTRVDTREADAILLRLIQEKEENALSMLYDQKGRLIYSIAINVVRNVSDAEEVVQQVFMRVWEKADSFDPAKGSTLAWMTTMTRRLAIDRTRTKMFKAQGREVMLDAAAVDNAHKERLGDEARKILIGAEALKVKAALEQLPDQYREVIRLSYFEGLSHAMIAAELDTPLGTIKSRIREAVIKLRQMLGVKE